MIEHSLFDTPDDSQDRVHPECRRATPALVLGSRDMSSGVSRSQWSECGLDAFLAMSEHEQLDYCARRDEDTAQFCEPEDVAFFLERAAWYRQHIEEMY